MIQECDDPFKELEPNLLDYLLDYQRSLRKRAEKAESDNARLQKQIEWITKYGRWDDSRQSLVEKLETAEAQIKELRKALQLLMADVEGYEDWERPCHALDMAHLALANNPEKS